MTLVQADSLVREFVGPRGDVLRAVDDVSFTIDEGEVLGLIGESGSGKSTVGRLVLRLLDPTSGRVEFDGRDLTQLSGAALRHCRREFQVVFQEPFESLNPRLTVGAIVEEPLIALRPDLSKAQRRERVRRAVLDVGLKEARLQQRPGRLSGGQQQRVGVARAIVVEPRFIVLDEPTSSLDLTVRASTLATLRRLQQDHGFAYLFISHDLETVRHFCDRVAVMNRGRIVETGPTQRVLSAPERDYTRMLLASNLAVFPDEWAVA